MRDEPAEALSTRTRSFPRRLLAWTIGALYGAIVAQASRQVVRGGSGSTEWRIAVAGCNSLSEAPYFRRRNVFSELSDGQNRAPMERADPGGGCPRNRPSRRAYGRRVDPQHAG